MQIEPKDDGVQIAARDFRFQLDHGFAAFLFHRVIEEEVRRLFRFCQATVFDIFHFNWFVFRIPPVFVMRGHVESVDFGCVRLDTHGAYRRPRRARRRIRRWRLYVGLLLAGACTKRVRQLVHTQIGRRLSCYNPSCVCECPRSSKAASLQTTLTFLERLFCATFRLVHVARRGAFRKRARSPRLREQPLRLINQIRSQYPRRWRTLLVFSKMPFVFESPRHI